LIAKGILNEFADTLAARIDRGGDVGWRHPGEEFDGLVARGSWAMSVVQTTALDPKAG
jgi:hypothetical protein